jgi:uncharacterized protein
MEEKSKGRGRGFASMNEEKQRAIASKGGRAAHEKGTAHEFTPEEAREAGRKGGEKISRDRAHMSAIGRRGGEAVSGDREHMASIGKKGGEARGVQARAKTQAEPLQGEPELEAPRAHEEEGAEEPEQDGGHP